MLFNSCAGLFFSFLFCLLRNIGTFKSTDSESDDDIVGFRVEKSQGNRKNQPALSDSQDVESDSLDYKQIKVTQKSGNKSKPGVQMQNQDFPFVPVAIIEYNSDAFQAESPSSTARMTKLPEMHCANQGHKSICVGSRNGLSVRAVYQEKCGKGKKYIVLVRVSGYRCKMEYSQVAIVAANTCTKYKIISTGTGKGKTKSSQVIRGYMGSKGTDMEVPVHYERTSGENQMFWCTLKNVENATNFYFRNECTSCFGFQLTAIRRKPHGSSSKDSSAAAPQLAIGSLMLVACGIAGAYFVL